MAENLTNFRNAVCGVLIFINILFLVFTITMKVKSDGLEKATVELPVSFLSMRHDNFEDWQISQLPSDLHGEGLVWTLFGCFI